MRILAIDTALGACSACVLDTSDPSPLAIEQTAMERGHAEALMPMIERVMAKVEGGFPSLDRVAVTIGPGSYTGLRVGISAARAIAFAAGIPAIGISTLAASAAPFIGREGGRVVAAAVDAKHGQVWFQAMNAQGKQLVSVRQVNHRDAARAIGAGPVSLVGSAALAVANEAWAIGLDALVVDDAKAPDVIWVARLGAIADPETAPPRPLYLKAPETTPQDRARLPRR
ncbi:tRNA (Adenosine(37)-N6)-threonylcarbamoyltransferase complex dimerization subunit type 1 TsaB [Bosea sp. 62]|uniref:tRNA (adenosine(37)-N6)-threonylcarbamoyltransferase complex dimerization subunit type 1 TsaB n=1 Tax=unclassified Bosea (in: a-proteobacteria) TaxID=2653178 RepID=UPI00125A6AA9|nr:MULTISPECIES: tRNA (adenosine(37)-N6)-threonylcarbamoyltransferase complex dimerization subunit type 1 TsaB [unclassified Bosea (in: a-proteobacteria)]CAD5283934.1 tRNA (Adenosine(37)-N6)-threonylcarbamoyltransferase complex dimerization subunit type 1 TsaB [Bosea sp. 21B]CAD5286679.1 tRNA (Adenosine(37)-N6)-threonylcarbamoyltransferase complex dimerization subunit type 1 TsaB [Bosea sp. 46]CAD5301769.1 tRNA (Adenosine(37)-N6)-threonylcarbamoyltransferase complex dimerization subunit type 1 T